MSSNGDRDLFATNSALGEIKVVNACWCQHQGQRAIGVGLIGGLGGHRNKPDPGQTVCPRNVHHDLDPAHECPSLSAQESETATQ